MPQEKYDDTEQFIREHQRNGVISVKLGEAKKILAAAADRRLIVPHYEQTGTAFYKLTKEGWNLVRDK